VSDTIKKARPIRGTVTSDKMNKSRVATVDRLVKNEDTGKYVRRRTKLMFHDETNSSRAGDEVLIGASRPLSARKRFSLLEVVKKAVD